MPRFSLFRTIRTAIRERRTGSRPLPPHRSRPSCRFVLETLEDRAVPAHVPIVVSSNTEMAAAIAVSNGDATTTPADPEIIQYSAGFTPTLTGLVQNTRNLEIDGDLSIVFDTVGHNDASLSNTGFLHVTGNLSLDDFGSLLNGQDATSTASLVVGGGLNMAGDADFENWGKSSIAVTGEISIGEGQHGSIVYNGGTSIDAPNADAAASISAGSFILGDNGLVYNEGASAISVNGDFTFGDGSSAYYNGLTGSSTASLSVGGNFSIGATAFEINYGYSTMVVNGNFTLGSNSSLENGIFDTDAASLSVGGSVTMGAASPFDNDAVTNTGASSIIVTHDFTILGEESSFVENGSTSTDAALMSVGGTFSMPATGQFLEQGTQSFQTKNFSLGDGSTFQDDGTMIVTGAFDAGASSSNDVIAGLFQAGAGSTVTTNTTVWEVQSGTLDVASGGSFSVPSGGTLQVDAGAAVTIEGSMTVDGIVDPPTITVNGGTLTIDASGQLTVGSLLLEGSGQLIQSSGSTVSVATPAAQQITFLGLSDKTASDPDFAISATSNSGLPVSFTASGSATVSLVGSTWMVHITGPGSATITAHQAGNASFLPADDVPQSFTISASSKQNQTILFGPISNVVYSPTTTSYTLSASATSFLAVSFAVVSGTSAESVSGSNGTTLTVQGGTPAGTQFTIEASQAGNANYNAAAPVDQTVTIGKASQSIAFGALPDKTFGNADFTLGATSDSGLPVSYSIVTGSAYASITGNTVHIIGATPVGQQVTIEADQAGNSNYNAASPVQESFSINKETQSISFGALANKTTSDPDFAVSATASSGLPVTFSASGSATVSLVSGTWTVHITGPGSATITANQAGNANFSAAAPVSQSFTISTSGTTVTVPSGQQYTYTDANGHSVSIKATGGATTTLSLTTVSGARMQLNSMAVTGATAATGLTVTAAGGTTINNLTIAGSAIHDINLAGVTVNGFSSSVPMHDLIAGSLQGSIQLTGGGYDVAVGSIGTSSGTAAVTLSGGFHNVVFGLVLSGSSFTLVGSAHDLAFGDVATGATLSLGTSTNSATIQDFAGGIISGSLLVYDSFHDGVVLAITGHVYLKSIGGTFITASPPAGSWVGADLPLVGGGDILLGSTGDKSKVIAL